MMNTCLTTIRGYVMHQAALQTQKVLEKAQYMPYVTMNGEVIDTLVLAGDKQILVCLTNCREKKHAL